MSGGWRLRVLYWILLPALAAAAGILGYYAYQSAAQFAALGEQSILQTTVLLVDEKVDRVEQQIIQADNAVFHLVDLEAPETLAEQWEPLAERISPSVRAVLVLDDGGEIISYATRLPDRANRNFRKVFVERVLPDLELERQRVGRLRHVHRSYRGETYLFTTKAVRHERRRHYLVAFHDPQYLVRTVFPTLLVNEEGNHQYNVVDEDNVVLYGPNLARAGDYLVGRRFPTTLYGWRLQIAPKEAPLLEARRRSGAITEVGLVFLSFVIILLGVTFLIYAATKESRLNQLRSEFVANVSHELKTPLSVVRMFAEMLLTGRVRNPERERLYLELILRESERLSALIENVLDFSALERGKQSYEMKSGNLSDLVQRAVETFRYRLEQEGLTVELSLPPSSPPVLFDEQGILLAILNLLDNAVKHGGTDGPVEVELKAGKRLAYITVRDHGPGIPEGQRRRVFERFYRVRRDGGTRGSGIGLSLVRQIVEAHGGRAWADNAEGGGAAVSFSLPLHQVGWEQGEEPTAGETATPETGAALPG